MYADKIISKKNVSQFFEKYFFYLLFIVLFMVCQLFKDYFELNKDLILKGEVWRILFAHFVHSSFIHFLVNLLILTFFIPNDFLRKNILFIFTSALFVGVSVFFSLGDEIIYVGFSGVLFSLLTYYFISQPYSKLKFFALCFLVISPIVSLMNFPYQQFDYVPVPHAHLFGVVCALIWTFFYKIKSQLVFTIFSLVFVNFNAYSALTDTPTSWSNFNFQDYKWAGLTVYDHESSQDPSHGISHGIQPASIDISSCSDDGSLPGNKASAKIAFYSDGLGGEWIALRMRLNDTPQEKSVNAAGYMSRHWDFLIDIDGDNYKEYVIDIDGTHASNNDDVVNLYYNNNNSHEVNPVADKINEFVASLNNPKSHTRIIEDNSVLCTGKYEYWLDVQIPLSAFTQGAVNSNSTFRLFMSTSTSNVDPLQKDWMESTCKGEPISDNFDYTSDPLKFGNAYVLNTNSVSSENGQLKIRVFTDVDGDLLLKEGDSDVPGFVATYKLIDADKNIIQTINHSDLGFEEISNYSFNSITVALPVGTYYVLAETADTTKSFTKSSPMAIEVTGCGLSTMDIPIGNFGVDSTDFYFIGFYDLDGNGVFDKNTENIYPFNTTTHPMTVKKGNSTECSLGELAGKPNPTACVYSNNGANTKVFTLVGNWSDAGFVPTTPTTISKEITNKTKGGYFYFGFAQASKISGVVYYDTNGDGIRNLGEPGLENVQLSLLFPNNVDPVLTTTDANGYYEFNGINTSGIYYIEEIDLNGHSSTTANKLPLNIIVGTNSTVNFGDITGGKLTGFTFSDTNGNQMYETTELSIGGVLISVFDSNGLLVTSTRTDNQGNFSFDLDPGGYRVVQKTPNGHKATTATDVQVYISNGGAATVVYGNIPLASIVDVVFEDDNANGIFDARERALSGITVEFDDGTSVTEFTTGGDGSFAHFQLTPLIEYISTTEILADYSNTTASTVSLTPPAGSAYFNYFGYVLNGTIAGEVYFDANQNGIRERSEPGISNVLITLKNSSGVVIDTQNTNFAGNYSFSGNAAGTYTVVEADPLNHLSTTNNTASVSLTAQDPNGSASFGDVPTGTISGQVKLDNNNNENFDIDDIDFSGVTLELSDGSTTVTDKYGSFLFINKPYNSYTVTMITPTGYYVVGSNSASVVIDATNNDSANFLINAPGEIKGLLYFDLNNNGSFDASDEALTGATIELVTSSNTTTDINGEFFFGQLIPNDYTVSVPNEDGCVAFASYNGSESVANSKTITLVPRAKEIVFFRYNCSSTGSISGKVKIDTDNNQTFDNSDTDLSGVTISLDDGSSTTTDALGEFIFENKDYGNYTVTMDTPNGYVSILDAEVNVTLDASDTANTNFLVNVPGVINGVLYIDKNENGTLDSDDELLKTFDVNHNANGQTQTNNLGEFEFSELIPSDYLIETEQKSGCTIYANYDSTETESSTQSVTLAPGDTLIINFRYVCESNPYENVITRLKITGSGALDIKELIFMLLLLAVKLFNRKKN